MEINLLVAAFVGGSLGAVLVWILYRQREEQAHACGRQEARDEMQPRLQELGEAKARLEQEKSLLEEQIGEHRRECKEFAQRLKHCARSALH